MMDFSTIDSFINDLKEMRGIAELDRHLLHLLLEMKPSVSETAQKFLCLCFSLWDDGNTHIEHRQRDTGGTEIRLLGTRHAVSALYRRKHIAALVLQSLAPHLHLSLRTHPPSLSIQFQDYAVGDLYAVEQ